MAQKLEKSKNLKEESTRHWDQIKSGLYDFDRAQADAEEMRKVTLEQFREFFAESIHPDAAKFRKLSIHFRSQKMPSQVDEFMAVNGKKKGAEKNETQEEEEEETLVRLKDGTVLVKNVAEFNASLELSRAPLPVVDLSQYLKQ